MLSTLEVHLSVGTADLLSYSKFEGNEHNSNYISDELFYYYSKYRTYVLNTFDVNDFFLIIFKLLEFRKIDCIIWNTPIIDPCVIL